MAATDTTPHQSRRNNLDTLRLILAALVVLEHCNNLFHVSNSDPSRFSFFLFNMSDVAVSCFFIISGMLTWISIERDPDIVRFYLRRLFRVFPAYWTVVALQVILFALVASAIVDTDSLFSYVLFNAITANFLEPSFLSGVPALNGSLWTIKIEVSYYLILPFLFAIMLRPGWLLLIALLSFVWATSIDHATLAKQLPGKLYLFGIGVALARIYGQVTTRHALIALVLLPVGIVLKFLTEDLAYWGEVTEAALGLCMVVAFSHAWMKREMIDISYTLYLVHYPIIVLLTRFLIPDMAFPAILIASLLLSLCVAVVLSLVVERPALRLGRKMVSRSAKLRPKEISAEASKP